MKLTFLGPSVRDPQSKGSNPGRLVNCFREPVQAGGRTEYLIRSVPGMAVLAEEREVAAIGWAFPGFSFGDHIYSVIAFEDTTDANILAVYYGNAVRFIGTDGDNGVFVLDYVSGDSEKALSAGGSYVLFTDGATVYARQLVSGFPSGVFTTTSLGAITAAGSISYLSSYAILTEKDGRRIQWSDPLDFDTFNGLNFATAEVTGEAIIRGMTVGSLFLAFKANSVSFWQVAGTGADALAVVPGRELDVGLKAYRLLTRIPDGCAFVSGDGKVYVFRGGLSPISTPALESALERYTPRDAFYYEWRGHGFICVTFEEIPAWCYDVALGEWHERSGPDGGPWKATCAAKFAGHWVFGTSDGKVVVASQRLEDEGQPLIRRMVSNTFDAGRLVRVDRVEIGARVGDGKIDTTAPSYSGLGKLAAIAEPPSYSETGAEPTPGVMIRVSRDDGHTWGPLRTRTLGEIGKFETRLVLRGLGQFRRAVMEITLASPIDTPIYSDATIEVS